LTSNPQQEVEDVFEQRLQVSIFEQFPLSDPQDWGNAPSIHPEWSYPLIDGPWDWEILEQVF